MEQPDVALAIIRRAQQVLLVRRVQAVGRLDWQFPGGKLQVGETPAQGAEREALEESGVVCQAVEILGERVHPDTGAPITYVACRYISGEPSVTRPNEIRAAEWVEVREVPSRVTADLAGCVRLYLNRSAHDPATGD